TCSGDALKTVAVTDVVLGFTVPSTVYVGTGTFSVPSTSLKGAVVGCDGVSGFSYDLCSGSGASCPEGGYAGTGLTLSGDPFAGGSLLIPKPAEGTWGIRIRYQYAPTGGCANKSTVKWPADGSAAPIVVSRTLPTIHLTNSSGVALCSYHPIYGETCSIETGVTGKAYAYVDGVQDPAPPAITWSFGSGPTKTGQGATFSYTTAGTYTVTLDGYGTPVARQISASAPSGGGGDPLGVSSFGVSNPSPTTGATVTFSCRATGGTAPYQYRFDYGDGQTRGFSTSSSAFYSYTSAGTYYAFCQISDAAGNSGQSNAQVMNVQQGGGGGPATCSLSVKDAQQGLDLQLGMGNK
ncbi:PKD domain-containing protein, partial [bacterium]|nr:PKD domain-containing protein [bacterium]